MTFWRNKSSLKAIALLCLLCASQVRYFFPNGDFIIVTIGLFIFLYDSISRGLELRYMKQDIFITFPFVIMVILAVTLLMVGDSGGFGERYIYIYALTQVAAILLVISSKLEYERKLLAYVFIVACLFEAAIVAGQFLYLNYGFGFPVTEGADGVNSALWITGSMYNPNNAATYIYTTALAACVYLSRRGRSLSGLLLLLVIFPSIFFTLSRTMTLLWALTTFIVYFQVWRRPVKVVRKNKINKIFVVFMTLFFIMVGSSVYNSIVDDGSNVLNRSLSRLESIGSLSKDESASFRLDSHLRLLERLPYLGLGSYSDRNYQRYFDTEDDRLMKVNPHSYIVEYSFLFGYLGFFTVIWAFSALISQIMTNQYIIFRFKVIVVMALLLSQSVPSSLLASLYFFVPFIFIARDNYDDRA